MAIGVVVLMITAVFVFRPAWLGFAPNYEYDLIDYDAAQTRAFAEDLVALGHPEWEGRMSGTTEEANTSAYIAAQFEAMGLSVPSIPTRFPCTMSTQNRACASAFRVWVATARAKALEPWAVKSSSSNTALTTSFRGSRDAQSTPSTTTFRSRTSATAPTTPLWASAAGSIGYVRSGADVGGNTGIFSRR